MLFCFFIVFERCAEPGIPFTCTSIHYLYKLVYLHCSVHEFFYQYSITINSTLVECEVKGTWVLQLEYPKYPILTRSGTCQMYWLQYPVEKTPPFLRVLVKVLLRTRQYFSPVQSCDFLGMSTFSTLIPVEKSCDFGSKTLLQQ